ITVIADHDKPQPSGCLLEISNKPYLGNMLNDFAGVDQQRVMHCRKAFSDAKVFK
ncbi:hypothetical protein ACS3EE_003603, partial [Escherichia coli]